MLAPAEAVRDFADWHRQRGHACARVDPLGLSARADDRMLRPQLFGLYPHQALSTDDAERHGVTHVAALDERLKAIYCGDLTLDCSAVRDAGRAAWCFDTFEQDMAASLETGPDQGALLDRLVAAQAWEELVGERHPHGKRFSLEGCESLIPLVHQLLAGAAQQGVDQVVLGAPHRGRVNLLVNVLGLPAQEVLEHFAGQEPAGWPQDLVYHLGRRHTVETAQGAVDVTLAFNPSHLQSVFPVVSGMVHAARAAQGPGTQGDAGAMLLALHGDAAFAGQGVVMETLHLTRHPGYHIGGTVHIVINNQVGFTAAHAMDGVQHRYCTDVARMVDAPVLRVNAEAADQLGRAAAFALAYRARFQADVLIDLVGYRRHGHSEHDVQELTRPQMAHRTLARPGVVQACVERLVRAGVASREALMQRVARARAAALAGWGGPVPQHPDGGGARQAAPAQLPTRANPPTPGQLQAWLRSMVALPDDFRPHAQVEALRQRWQRAAADETAPVDWCLAENLAYASLLAAGVPVRISGMDVQRGTFFHRHAVWHDQASLRTHVPLLQLGAGAAGLTVVNSPLAEEAVLGFEYGRSVLDTRTLALWEAQFGDFVNEAQVYLDQYLSSGEAKWGQTAALGVLLPHGYEGNGPEHSTGYLSRFLLLCGDDNLRVVCPSTAVQWFHLLRQQALDPVRKPLIALTPKGSLYAEAASHGELQALSRGGFAPLLGDDRGQPAEQVHRVVLSSGKLHYDLARGREELQAHEVALWRLEQLYPFPRLTLTALLAAHPQVKELVWAQEEHLNQGAWSGIRDELTQACRARGIRVRCVSRVANAAGATASVHLHRREQRELVLGALSSAGV
ncbi:2-oxoglutarate dehydrogenase E1 component [Ideonella sp. B508-1]|uniref:2-oxoglutarate dehydrogenase E1 component n=1 Tax=Ideonella sp. B508-1 TaxID=137716 RepID=UPI0003B3B68F|nr:2-oxoglutarate dehydrogenase E1 component [Ideonella sp. B508-1]